MVAAWYAGNTLYNIYNKKATNMIHAHWFVAAAQLVVGIVWSMVMWGTGMRKMPNLTASDIAACVPIGLFACLAHAGSVLAVSVLCVTWKYYFVYHYTLQLICQFICLDGVLDGSWCSQFRTDC